MKVSQTSWHYRIFACSGHADKPIGRLGYCGAVASGLILTTGGLTFAMIGAAFVVQAIAFMTGLATPQGAGVIFLLIGSTLIATGLTLAHSATGILERPVSWVKQRFAADPIVVTE